MNRAIWFRWLGIAGIELRVGDQILAIDPTFTRIPFWRLWFGRIHSNLKLVEENLPHCNAVLVTHAHYDHLMDVPDVVRTTGATAMGSPNTCRLLEVLGTPPDRVRVIGVDDRLDLGDFQVEVLQAQHMKTPGFSPGPLSRWPCCFRG